MEIALAAERHRDVSQRDEAFAVAVEVVPGLGRTQIDVDTAEPNTVLAAAIPTTKERPEFTRPGQLRRSSSQRED